MELDGSEVFDESTGETITDISDLSEEEILEILGGEDVKRKNRDIINIHRT